MQRTLIRRVCDIETHPRNYANSGKRLSTACSPAAEVVSSHGANESATKTSRASTAHSMTLLIANGSVRKILTIAQIQDWTSHLRLEREVPH